jgi:flagellar basal-body rod protein FlgB
MLNGIANRLEHYLDLVSARQKLVASNIANANTPGYHTKDIDFHFEFMSQVEKAASTVETTPPCRSTCWKWLGSGYATMATT